jgi:hypothetical protein
MHYDELHGGNFSIEAICDAVGMLDNFSTRELKWHWLDLPATDFCRAAFADGENLPVAGLVLHVSKRSHYMAVLRQDTSDAAQILLLDSVYPDRIEILSPQQFHDVANRTCTRHEKGKDRLVYQNRMLQVLRGKVIGHCP